ncbi:hypothetical protein LCGC14_2431720, partial [marine sediment metagenome]
LQIYLNTISVETNATYGNSGSISLNSWQFIAIRYNDSNVDVMINDLWIYNATGAIPEPWNGGGNLVNGGDFTTGAETTDYSCFSGSIEQLSVFNKSIGNLEIEDHKGMPMLSLSTRVSKEDGLGGWTPITTNEELIEGYVNFEVNASDNDVKSLAFYISDSEPDIVNPEPNNWSLIVTYTNNIPSYNYPKNSWTIPDNSWYFVAKGVDIYNNTVYDYYNFSFKIDHFNDLINFTYLSKNGRINEHSQIGVIPKAEFEWPISEIELYINYSNDIDSLANLSYYELYSNDWLIYLDSLSDWILDKGLTPNNYNVNFILKANFTYGQEFPYYTFNYTMHQTILDIKGPDLTLFSGGTYSLTLESVYDNVLENLITMAINSTDPYFDSVKLQYKYDTPSTANWITYNLYEANNNSLASISWDIINLRDDNLTFRFVGYDDLNNEKVLEATDYWIVKDFNNHLQFVVEGIESSQIYGLESDDTIDLDVKIIPVDNDITRVSISTGYESFDLTTVFSEQEHIYFDDSSE